jgi:hypothetical protein
LCVCLFASEGWSSRAGFVLLGLESAVIAYGLDQGVVRT